MESPVISIIIATYNRAHLVSEAIESILAQTFKKWECLIIDDGSSDRTEEIIRDFVSKDIRFCYLKRPEKYQKGLPGCRNYGLDLAAGKFVIFFDDDDIVHPQNLEICLNLLNETGLDFCHYRKKSFVEVVPKYDMIQNNLETYQIGIDELEEVVTNRLALASCTVMWKKTCLEGKRFYEFLSYAEEWELYTRLLLDGCCGIGVDEVLYFNRKHVNSNTGEFWQGNPNRRKDYRKAIELVIDELLKRSRLSDSLVRHFIKTSVFIKDRRILDYILKKSAKNRFFKIKYQLFYKLYPVLAFGYRAKKKFKTIRS